MTQAVDIANEIAKVFEKKIAKIMSISNVSVVSKATANPTPVSPKLNLAALVGLLFGILVAFAWGMVRELTDQTVKEIDFITDALGLVDLGAVNYVHRMKDMDQVIEANKTEVQNSSDSFAEPDFPQRSRRRV